LLYRPDRVVFRNGFATIIDYKTGRPGEAHRAQVLEYARLLREMSYQVEGAYLIYLDGTPELRQVI
jgi:CRISPR/Cas system-associated exonuclease Cas4 (RecB family)